MENLNQSDDTNLAKERNAHWRIEANYEKDVLPLRLRLESVKWHEIVEWHKPHWKRGFVRGLSLGYQLGNKGFWYGNFRLKSGRWRLIQRDRLLPYSTYRIRLSLPIPDPAELDQREYNRALEQWRKVYAARDERKRKEILLDRKYLADRLGEISRQLGDYGSQSFRYSPRLDSSDHWELSGKLKIVLEPESSTFPNRSIASPTQVGEAQAAVEYFWLCLREFHEAEITLPTAPSITTISVPVKGTPTYYVRRYFPQAATIHGTTASNSNALHQLAVWLLHWAERPNDEHYSLLGQLREQMATHPKPGKFLKACEYLHEALILLTATEQSTKVLLEKEYTPHSYGNLRTILRWWAGWIREQIEIQLNPTGAYLAALKRISIVEERDNGTPRYSVPLHLIEWDGFSADIAPLRQAFDNALPNLNTDQKRALRQDLGALLSIDPARLQWQREMFDRQEYFPANLPADYPCLRFEVVSHSGGLSNAHNWVSPMFWSGLRALLQYKQIEGRNAFEKLNAALGEVVSIPKSNVFTTPQATAPAESFTPLLLNYTLSDLTALLKELGLLSEAGRATPAASPGAWIGVIYGLLEANPPRLRKNKAAIRRALLDEYDAKVSESSLNKGLGKTGSEAEQFRNQTLIYLSR